MKYQKLALFAAFAAFALAIFAADSKDQMLAKITGPAPGNAPAAGKPPYSIAAHALVSKDNSIAVNAWEGYLDFQGATWNNYSTRFAFTEPTADRTITFQNATGTVAFETFENVTATNIITAAENGKVFLLNSATEFVSTLPAPAIGLHFTFIVTAAPSGASYTVVTTSSANIIKGMQVCAADAAGDTGTADDTVTFADGQAVAGDMIEVWSDGTSWFVVAKSRVAAGITFTQAS